MERSGCPTGANAGKTKELWKGEGAREVQLDRRRGTELPPSGGFRFTKPLTASRSSDAMLSWVVVNTCYYHIGACENTGVVVRGRQEVVGRGVGGVSSC